MYNSGKYSMYCSKYVCIMYSHKDFGPFFTKLRVEFGIKRSRSYNCWLLEADDWVCLKKSGDVFL